MADETPDKGKEPPKPDANGDAQGTPETPVQPPDGAPAAGGPPKAAIPQPSPGAKRPQGIIPPQRRIVIPLRATQAIKVRKAQPRPEAAKSSPAAETKPDSARDATEGAGKGGIPLRATQSIKAARKTGSIKAVRGKTTTTRSGRKKVSIPLRATQAITPQRDTTAAKKTAAKKVPSGKAKKGIPLRATQPIMPKSQVSPRPMAKRPPLIPVDPSELPEVSEIKDAVPMRDTQSVKKSLTSSATRIPVLELKGDKPNKFPAAFMPRVDPPKPKDPAAQKPVASIPMKATQPIGEPPKKKPVSIPMRATQPIDDLDIKPKPAVKIPMSATQPIGKDDMDTPEKTPFDKSKIIAQKATQPIQAKDQPAKPMRIPMAATQPVSVGEDKTQKAPITAAAPVIGKPPPRKIPMGQSTIPMDSDAPPPEKLTAKPAVPDMPESGIGDAPPKKTPVQATIPIDDKAEPPPKPVAKPAIAAQAPASGIGGMPPRKATIQPTTPIASGANPPEKLEEKTVTDAKPESGKQPPPEPSKKPEEKAPEAAPKAPPKPKIALGGSGPSQRTMRLDVPDKLPETEDKDAGEKKTAEKPPAPKSIEVGGAPPKIKLAPQPTQELKKPIPAAQPVPPIQPKPAAATGDLKPAGKLIEDAAKKTRTMPLDVPDSLPESGADKPPAAPPKPSVPKLEIADEGISPSPDLLETAEKNTTMPIDIPGEEEPAAAAAVGIPAKRKSETSRLDITEAKPSREMTMAVEDMPTIIQSVPPQGVLGKLKKDTSRLDLAEAASADEEKPKMGILSEAKSETSKIDLSEAHAAAGTTDLERQKEITSSLDDVLKQAQEATMRIEIEETGGRAGTDLTQPVQAIGQTAQRERTAKVDLSNILGKDKPGAPKTVVRSRPGGTQPKTMKIKRPGSTEAGAAKTIAKQPAPGAASAAGAPTIPKDGTAKLDLPDGPGAPTVQRKTIRIKRPGGTSAVPGKPALQISRPDEAGGSKPEMGGAHAMPMAPAAVQATAKGPGVLFFIMTLFAMITVGVLIYVLYAQYESIGLAKDTVSMSFPGMIE